MITCKEKIGTLIPQAPPFVMVDNLVHTDGTKTRCSLMIREDNIFVSDGYFREPGITEHIAQTAAARSGYDAQQQDGPVLVGYIGSIRNLEFFRLPKVGEELVTDITVMNQVFNVTMINGKVHCGDELVAQCEMKIFISKS